MKHTNYTQTPTNIYTLLLDSEDKQQSLSETIVYLLLILMAAFSMWFAANQPVRIPVGALMPTASVAVTAGNQTL